MNPDEVTSPETEVTPEVKTEINELASLDTLPEGIEPEAEEDPIEEFDYEGKKYQAPKALKEAVMRHADYTQKTQELAKNREAIAAKEKEITEFQATYRENVKEFSALMALNDQIEQYHNLDWDTLIEQDPVQAQKLQLQLNRLTNERNQRAQTLQQKEAERLSKQQSEMTRREEEGRTVLQREIKNWNPELENKLREYAVTQGAPNAKEVKFALHPQETRILHKAYLYDQLMKQAAAKPKEQPVIPTSKVTGGKSSNVPTEYKPGMSDAQYDAWRERQRKRPK